MKFTTINIGETKIEFYNTLLGKETIKVNGMKVASKWTFSGTVHNFTVEENGEEVLYKLKTGTGVMGMMFDLKRNEVAIIESPKSKVWGTFFLVAIILIAMAYFAGVIYRGLQ